MAIIVFADASHAVELPETPKLYITTNGPQVSLYWDEVSGANNYTLIASNLNDGSFFGQFDVGANTQVSTSLPEGSGFFVQFARKMQLGVATFLYQTYW